MQRTTPEAVKTMYFSVSPHAAGTCGLAEKTTQLSLFVECRRHTTGCHKLMLYRLFRDVFVKSKTLAVWCVMTRVSK